MHKLTIGKATDNLRDVSITGDVLTFSYNISEPPHKQWWVIYQGVMPSYNDVNSNKLKWDWISNHSSQLHSSTITCHYNFKRGGIYTLALFKDNDYGLADYRQIHAE